MTILAQLDVVTAGSQWNWVFLAYGFTVVALGTYTASIAVRLQRARKRYERRP